MKKLRSNGPELLKLKAVYGPEYVQTIYSRSLRQKSKWQKIAIYLQMWIMFDI